jgi:hypothetical protein
MAENDLLSIAFPTLNCEKSDRSARARYDRRL